MARTLAAGDTRVVLEIPGDLLTEQPPVRPHVRPVDRVGRPTFAEAAPSLATASSKTCVEAALPALRRNLPGCGEELGVPRLVQGVAKEQPTQPGIVAELGRFQHVQRRPRLGGGEALELFCNPPL